MNRDHSTMARVVAPPASRAGLTPCVKPHRDLRDASLRGLRAVLKMAVAALGVMVAFGCAPPEARLAGARRAMVLEYLTEACSGTGNGARVLAVGNPFADLPGGDPRVREAEASAVAGVARGTRKVGGTYVGRAVPEIRRESAGNPSAVSIPPGATTPVSFLSSLGAWDRIRDAHPEATVWISWIGVPVDLVETRIWSDPKGPRFGLYLPDLRLIGTPDAVRSQVMSGRIAAIVLARPGAPPESEPMLAGGTAEFERRYVLVTSETWDTVARAWPSLLSWP